MARETVRAIALKLGNAIAAPVLPFSPNRASAELPGTIGLTPELFQAINEQVAEELIKTGFKNIVLMGDHGGGQAQLGEAAKTLSAKYAGQGVKVVFCDEVYEKANGDFDKWLQSNGYPTSSHAGIPGHLRDALSGRRQRLGAQGIGEGCARRSGRAAGTEAGSVEAARQQRDQRRRPALDGGTRQEDRST